jgi:hypothetical protein
VNEKANLFAFFPNGSSLGKAKGTEYLRHLDGKGTNK